MVELQGKKKEALKKSPQDQEKQLQLPLFSSPSDSGLRNVWPLLLILAAIAMSIIRLTLLTKSEMISWTQYKIIMILLTTIGFSWLLSVNKKHWRKILGYGLLTLSILLFSLFISTGSDKARSLNTYGLFINAFLFTIGIVLSLTKNINFFTILGSLMVTAGLLHFMGALSNAAGVELPSGFYIRMILLFWSGWIIYFLGKKPTTKRFIMNMIILIIATITIFLMIISVIH
jgi:hypothetical protein